MVIFGEKAKMLKRILETGSIKTEDGIPLAPLLIEKQKYLWIPLAPEYPCTGSLYPVEGPVEGKGFYKEYNTRALSCPHCRTTEDIKLYPHILARKTGLALRAFYCPWCGADLLVWVKDGKIQEGWRIVHAPVIKNLIEEKWRGETWSL